MGAECSSMGQKTVHAATIYWKAFDGFKSSIESSGVFGTTYLVISFGWKPNQNGFNVQYEASESRNAIHQLSKKAVTFETRQ